MIRKPIPGFLWFVLVLLVHGALGGPAAAGAAQGGSAPTVSAVSDTSVPRWGRYEAAASFDTTAQNPYWPFDAGVIEGVPSGTGVSADALLLPPGRSDYNQARVQPCFWYHPFREEALTPGTPHLIGDGDPHWRFRYSPDTLGTWRYKLRVTDASGTRFSAEQTFTCTPSDSHGYLRVSPADSRYFEFSDGTPFVAVAGHHTEPAEIARMASAFNMSRPWWQGSTGKYAIAGVSGQGGRVAWEGDIVPVAGEPGTVALRLRAENQTDSSLGGGGVTRSAVVALPDAGRIAGRTYRFRARVKLENIAGPFRNNDAAAGSRFGLSIQQFNQDAQGNTHFVLPFESGSSDWHTVEGTLNSSATTNPGSERIKLMLVNCSAGTAYVRDLQMFEANGEANLLATPSPNVHQEYSQVAAFYCDRQLDAATANGVYLKIVTTEKQDDLWDNMNPNGSFRTGSRGHLPRINIDFDGAGNQVRPFETDNGYGGSPQRTGTNAIRWYYQAYFRYLSARYGWSPNIHSWEFLNEGNPDNGVHQAGAEWFADQFHALGRAAGRPMMAGTSTWHSQTVLSQSPALDYVDVHRFVGDLGRGLPDLSQVVPEPGNPANHVLRQHVPSGINPGAGEGQTPLDPIALPPGNYRLSWRVRGENVRLEQPGITDRGTSIRWFAQSAHDRAPTGANGWLGDGPNNTGGTGTFGWREASADITIPAGYPYLLLWPILAYASGTAYFDDFQLVNTDTGVVVPMLVGDLENDPRLASDTALFGELATREYIGPTPTGGSALGKPWVWGESTLSGPQTRPSPYRGFVFIGQDQRVYDDLEGVWLHKGIWSQIAPGNPTIMWWWMDSILAYNLVDSGRAYRAFLSGLPLSNGRYRDALAVCTGGLRATGQKDVQGGRAHLWIDNPQATWLATVENRSVSPLSGTVEVSGFAAGEYAVEYWDTRAGRRLRSETVAVPGGGTLQLSVRNLSSDIAVKIGGEATTSGTTVHLSVDNRYEVYFNGQSYAPGANQGAWENADTFENIADLNTIAVRAINDEPGSNAAGLIAKIVSGGGTSLVSDTTWKVFHVADGSAPPADASGRPWYHPDYDDSGWQNAKSHGSYGVAPWGTQGGLDMMTGAQWIWVDDATNGQGANPVYLRKSIR